MKFFDHLQVWGKSNHKKLPPSPVSPPHLMNASDGDRRGRAYTATNTSHKIAPVWRHWAPDSPSSDFRLMVFAQNYGVAVERFIERWVRKRVSVDYSNDVEAVAASISDRPRFWSLLLIIRDGTEGKAPGYHELWTDERLISIDLPTVELFLDDQSEAHPLQYRHILKLSPFDQDHLNLTRGA